jgi:hypothetical protein
VKLNVDQHTSDCFAWTYIFSSVLVTGFYTYPEHTPSFRSCPTMSRDAEIPEPSQAYVGYDAQKFYPHRAQGRWGS